MKTTLRLLRVMNAVDNERACMVGRTMVRKAVKTRVIERPTIDEHEEGSPDGSAWFCSEEGICSKIFIKDS